MGMIARVRRRVRANSLTIDKEKTAQSVCLLSAVLLLPYCPRGPLPLLPSPAPVLYSALVLPVVLSANYRYPVPTLKTLAEAVKGGAKRAWHPLNRFLRRLYAPVDRAENLFLKMRNLSVMANQIVFLILADRVLLPQQRLTCLYTLMFYNVIAYCVSYIKELIQKEDWSPYVTLTERSKIKHLAMSATKIVLEWTKAVTFVVTLTFMLLVFGLEQGLDHYKPSLIYTVVTWIYYSATEKVFVEMFPTILGFLQLEALENIENLYAPVILRCFTIAMSLIFSILLLPSASWRFLMVATYLNVYLRWKELMQNSGAVLRREREVLNRYRKATLEEIERFDDVCAVCLCSMTKARVTPCHHLFHADCLRQCLKTSDKCPMCKRELKFD
ncbi:ERAD-associated E3 ubiquitin-protein ligase HRD1B-like [Pogonomyrmex barbatus]|uniref:ERAD-associated E3 ubiquitin-protein ligase HRD1B-like n=1 Tax=Pogonomyrmex barbatus TaxID=144034 RepID=A0A6I9X0G2_9HYME|nr:ERAD-associated E3 ubiquitin-protein ligase HRD1B-like [Pogonomyrmex barbatus]